MSFFTELIFFRILEQGIVDLSPIKHRKAESLTVLSIGNRSMNSRVVFDSSRFLEVYAYFNYEHCVFHSGVARDTENRVCKWSISRTLISDTWNEVWLSQVVADQLE
jgi:hypothetical protein